ncbi:hypothetical protein ACVNS2_13130 [Paenibacillus caseinilyticus]|uniref:Uncharacterized protein n=1 Tax=Paenibacillus mucilaginosus K02 TaxID=997761 RepID=I0BGS8_9BACL|nr:hypothetical protein [Paenibacillus mucilaginosus]AFH61575.1 hypothetical protein B2K_12715 [Paenibacillus mucilaginosus K02]
MMQRIRSSSLQELSREQQENLRRQWTPQEGDYIAIGDHEEMVYYLNGVDSVKALPLLTIGEMIAYLNGQGGPVEIREAAGTWIVRAGGEESRSAELCEALWEAVKRAL